jgi:hypothetical protein
LPGQNQIDIQAARILLSLDLRGYFRRRRALQFDLFDFLRIGFLVVFDDRLRRCKIDSVIGSARPGRGNSATAATAASAIDHGHATGQVSMFSPPLNSYTGRCLMHRSFN